VIRAITFSVGNDQVATSSAESTRVWSAKSGELQNEFNGHARVRTLAFHPKFRKLYSFGAGVIRDWDLDRVARPI